MNQKRLAVEKSSKWLNRVPGLGNNDQTSLVPVNKATHLQNGLRIDGIAKKEEAGRGERIVKTMILGPGHRAGGKGGTPTTQEGDFLPRPAGRDGVLVWSVRKA